jgi:hypothetical protein
MHQQATNTNQQKQQGGDEENFAATQSVTFK